MLCFGVAYVFCRLCLLAFRDDDLFVILTIISMLDSKISRKTPDLEHTIYLFFVYFWCFFCNFLSQIEIYSHENICKSTNAVVSHNNNCKQNIEQKIVNKTKRKKLFKKKTLVNKTVQSILFFFQSYRYFQTLFYSG